MDESRHIKKESLLKALEQSLGVVTVACKKAGIPRSTFYKWMKEDEGFAKEVKEIDNLQKVNYINRLQIIQLLLQSFI